MRYFIFFLLVLSLQSLVCISNISSYSTAQSGWYHVSGHIATCDSGCLTGQCGPSPSGIQELGVVSVILNLPSVAMPAYFSH